MGNLKRIRSRGIILSGVLLTMGLCSCGLLDPQSNDKKDTEDPVITLSGDNPDTAYAGIVYNDPGYTAVDNEDGTLTSSVEIDYGELDTGGPDVGTYTVTYTVKDEAGNSDEVTRKVVVIQKTDITITSAMITDASSCPVVFDDTGVVYTIGSSITITSSCNVTFGAHTNYIVKGRIDVEDGGTLTILEGARLAFDDNAYISVGETGNGTLKAIGTEDDSIQFISHASGTNWGYGSSATSSGGFWFADAATAACSLTYCIIDGATSGLHIEDASVTISHCRISGNEFYGIYCTDGGSPTDSAGFIDNVVTGNGGFGVGIYANFAGALSGTGSFTGNTKGAIQIIGDYVEENAVWKKHDAPYVVKDRVSIGSGSEATLTIRPGCAFELQDGAYFSIGENGTASLIANGTEDDSISFTNYTGGTVWGYGSGAASSGGFWFDDAATAACSLTYCTIDSATSGLHIEDASVTVSHCRISGNDFYGIYCADGGSPTDSAGFVDNVVTGNGEFGVGIYANFVGALSGTGSFTGNTKGAILIMGDYVEENAVWKKHDAPYVVEGRVRIGSGSEATLTIRAGSAFELQDDAYFSIGENGTASLIANGTEDDSISFTNYTGGTVWGYGSSAASSGGFWFDDAAAATCSLTYCTIDSATTGIRIEDASVTISNCRISGNQFYGMYCADGGAPTDSAGFMDNTITGNGEFGIALYANYVGALSGTGTVDGNTKGAILIKPDNVEDDAVWRRHDAPYVVEGRVGIGAAGGVTVTMVPGAAFELQDGAYFSVGESDEGTLIAEGTESDSIMFSEYSSGTYWGYGSSATSSGGFWIDDMATSATSLKYCSISNATTGIRIETADVAVTNCMIADCEFWGMYLYDCPATKIADNSFSGNGSGGTGTN